MAIQTLYEYMSKLEISAHFHMCYFFLSSIEHPNPNEMLLIAHMKEYMRTLDVEIKEWENAKRPS